MGKFRKHGAHHAHMKPKNVAATQARCSKLVWRSFWGRCEAAGNARRFPTRNDARVAARQHPGHPEPYRCDACRDYHLGLYDHRTQRAIDLLLRSLLDDFQNDRLDAPTVAAFEAATAT